MYIMAEDLKFELLQLKKQSANLYAENQLLKVKMRKLENENSKKNKQIESLIDPKKCANIRKIVSEHGTLMLLQLEEQCKNYQSNIIAKDSKIRKLETEIKKLKIYCNDQSKISQSKMENKRSLSVNENYNSFLFIPKYYNNSIYSPTSASDVYFSQLEKTEQEKLQENLEKIKKRKQFLQENDVCLKELCVDSKKSEQENNSCELKKIHTNDNEKFLHVEKVEGIKSDIQNLQIQIKNIIDEIIIMKKLVQDLSVEQEKTKEIFQEKCVHFSKILKQFEELQVQDYLNLIDTHIATVKKSASYSKRKKSRYWLTVKKDEIATKYKPKNDIKSLINDYPINFVLKQENNKDSDDEDVQTGE